MTVEDVLEFGRRWDPQPMHVDPVAATGTHFGGLIASGIHSLAILQRLAVETFYGRTSVLAARGLTAAQFLRPLPPDTTVWAEIEVGRVRAEGAARVALVLDMTLRGSERAYLTDTVDVLLHRLGP